MPKFSKDYQPRHVDPALYDVPDAAAYLHLSRAQVYVEVAEGRLAAHKVGAKTVFKRAELDRFIENLPTAPIGKAGRAA